MEEELKKLAQINELFQSVVIAISEKISAQDVWMIQKISNGLAELKEVVKAKYGEAPKARRAPHVKQALDAVTAKKY